MPRIIQPARFAGSTAPEVQSMGYAAAQTFKKGAILVYQGGATGLLIEASADPVSIVGIALEPVDSKPGFGIGNSASVVATTGRVQEVSIAKANRQTIFTGRMVNGGTDPVTPAQTDIGKVYGTLKTAAGEWVIDQTETTTTSVRIVDIDIDNKIVFFRFLEAVLATP